MQFAAMRPFVFLVGALALSACATPPNIAAPALTNANHPTQRFAYCTSAGCGTQVWVRFTDAEWGEIAAFFAGTRDAADERDRIARAMSRFEQIAGPKAGTQNDEGGWDMGGPEVGQLDCFAEAANTGTTLKMIADAGLLRFHTPLTGEPTMRGVPYGTFGLVHAGATIRENANGRLWVVDTWYLGNGAPSFVVDRDAWRGGWSPPSGAGS